MARKKNQKRGEKKEETRIPNNKRDQKESQSKSQDIRKEGQSQVSSDESGTEKTNDPEWYARDPQLLLDAGSIPFSDVFGNPVAVATRGESHTFYHGKYKFGDTITQYALPGICVLRTIPSVGNAEARYSPANVAATALYTHVRYVNSGRKNYDQADLMIYALAIADLYAYVNWLIRIYNCAYVFSQRNKYVGKALIEAQGVNPDSVVNNLANFRYIINVFINKIASYACPASINLFKKRAFQYAAIYSESAVGSIKDQLYMYSPAAFFQFKLDDKNKGSLQLYSVYDNAAPYPNLLDVAGLQEIGNNLLSNMWGDEDFGIMSGDILKAFDNDIVGLSEIGEEGGLEPLYDPFVLHQMKNSTIVGSLTNAQYSYYQINIGSEGSPDYQYCKVDNVYQDGKGDLISKHGVQFCYEDTSLDSPRTCKQMYNMLRKPIISIDAAVADPAMVVEISRNMAVHSQLNDDGFIGLVDENGEGVDSDGIGLLSVDTGDIIVQQCDLFLIIPDNSNGRLYHFAFDSNLVNRGNTTEWGNAWPTVHFEYMPITFDATFTVPETTGGTADMSWITPRSDLNNYTIQEAAVIARLHELCMLSLLYVPGVAKQINYMNK